MDKAQRLYGSSAMKEFHIGIEQGIWVLQLDKPDNGSDISQSVSDLVILGSTQSG
jgi:hypothetical protein